MRCTIDRTMSSGFVSRDPIRDMLKDRCAAECTSVMGVSNLLQHKLLQHNWYRNLLTVAEHFDGDFIAGAMTFDF